MESELRSVREAACGQERTIQTLNDSLNTKDCEVCLPLKRKAVAGISGIPHMLETHCLAFELLDNVWEKLDRFEEVETHKSVNGVFKCRKQKRNSNYINNVILI